MSLRLLKRLGAMEAERETELLSKVLVSLAEVRECDRVDPSALGDMEHVAYDVTVHAVDGSLESWTIRERATAAGRDLGIVHRGSDGARIGSVVRVTPSGVLQWKTDAGQTRRARPVGRPGEPAGNFAAHAI